jgi:molybdate transport system regulatory protein
VILARQENDDSKIATSARNSYPGTIATLKTSAVACEVIVNLPEGSVVCALMTLESVKKLDLKPGAAVLVMFTTFSVILNVE